MDSYLFYPGPIKPSLITAAKRFQQFIPRFMTQLMYKKIAFMRAIWWLNMAIILSAKHFELFCRATREKSRFTLAIEMVKLDFLVVWDKKKIKFICSLLVNINLPRH